MCVKNNKIVFKYFKYAEKIQKSRSEKNLISLNGVLFFLTSYWLFFHIVILTIFIKTYNISILT